MAKCCSLSVKGWSVGLIFVVVLYVTAAILCYATTGDIKDNLQCVIDGYKALINSGTLYPTLDAGKDAASEIDEDVIDQADNWMDKLDLLLAAPGTISFALTLIVILTAILGRWKGCCRVTSKVFVFIMCFWLVFALIYFAALAIIGFMSGSGKVRDQWEENVEVACAYTDTLAAQLVEAKASGSAGQIAGATAQLAVYTKMCSCIDDTPDSMSVLAAPGVIGFVATVLAFFFTGFLCCAMSCCRIPTSQKIQEPPKEAGNDFISP